MAKEITLPQLGQTMEEGTIVNILIKEGDEVKKADVIFEIETDKATLEMESSDAGFVKKILVKEGQTVPVGAAVVILGEKDEEVADITPATPAEPAAVAPAAGGAECPGAKVVTLPQLGQTMEEGTIVNILIEQDGEVKKGDVIFEVETDKATLEMESADAGFVKKILVEAGQTVPVGNPVVILADKDTAVGQGFIDSVLAGGTVAAEVVEEKPAPAIKTPEPAPVAQTVKPAPVTAEKTGRIFVSPRAKTIATELGINLSAVTPAAGNLRITEADVRKAAGSASTAVQPQYKLGEKVAMTKMQKIVGQRMLESKLNIPCFYLNVVADMTDLVKMRSKLNASREVKISFNDFIIRAMGIALKQYPIMTGQVAGDSIQLAKNINIGLAIEVEDGLVAPLIKDADQKDAAQIAADSKAIIAKAKSGKLMPDDLSGGCITLSNLGAFGIDSFIPIVVPGQCSILGTGAITDTCVASNGNILVRKLMKMTLSVDHKVANGAYAARFLDHTRKLLEDTSTFA